jgi:hypothetical protein
MSTNPKLIVLKPAKAVELVGETALEIQLHRALGGELFSAGQAHAALIWWAMFRENLDSADAAQPIPANATEAERERLERRENLAVYRMEELSGIGRPEGVEPGEIPALENVFMQTVMSNDDGFTESMATTVRALFWEARNANERIVATRGQAALKHGGPSGHSVSWRATSAGNYPAYPGRTG